MEKPVIVLAGVFKVTKPASDLWPSEPDYRYLLSEWKRMVYNTADVLSGYNTDKNFCSEFLQLSGYYDP